LRFLDTVALEAHDRTVSSALRCQRFPVPFDPLVHPHEAMSAIRLLLIGSFLVVGSAHVAAPASAQQPIPLVQKQLTASDGAARDEFGSSVALSADGSIAIVGAPFKDLNDPPNPFFQFPQGAVYVYVRQSDGSYRQVQRLELELSDLADAFYGFSVALSPDSKSLFVGAPSLDVVTGDVNPDTLVNAGRVFSYTQEADGTYSPDSSFTLFFDDEEAGFGNAVAVSGDNGFIDGGDPVFVVGASGDSTGVVTDRVQSGSAFIYIDPGLGPQRLRTGLDQGDSFGASVALSFDGTTAIVGAPNDDAGQGSVRVFRGDLTTQDGLVFPNTQTLTASDGTILDNFGGSVALSDDGAIALVGAYNSNDGGSVYAFVRESDGTYTERQKLVASDATPGDFFGFSVSMNADGTVALIGAPGDGPDTFDPEIPPYLGSMYLFVRQSNGTYVEQQKLVPIDGGGRFGHAVALSANSLTALGGGKDATINGNFSQGSAFAFTALPDLQSSSTRRLTSTDAANGIGVSFGDTGVSIDFPGGTTPGTVTVSLYGNPPANVDGITESNVSSYRLVITAEGGLVTASGTTVHFDASRFAGITDPNTLSVYSRSTVGTGTFTALTPVTFDPSVGTEGEFSVTVDSFSEFAFASDDPGNPLPVELAAFTAVEAPGGVALTWQTASETDNAGFHVQRQTGTGAFTDVHFAPGAGTTTAPQRYRFTDRSVPFAAEALTYRLRQVDSDGTATLSDAVEVTLGAPDRLELLAPYPNPARDGATLRYALPAAADVELAVYDVLGRRVAMLADEARSAGRVERRLDTRRLPSGVYFVRLVAGGEVRTQRLTVVR
jgi:hypothetical protein